MLLESILEMFNLNKKTIKVCFPNREYSIKAMIVMKNTGGYYLYDENVFGLISGKQIKLLDENNIPYERLNSCA